MRARLPAWPQLGTTSVLFETGSLLRNAIAKVLPKDILDNVKRRLSPKCSLPSVVLAAYAHALGRASRGEASVVQYSHPGRTKADRRTYGQLATDANVLLDDLSAAPTVGGVRLRPARDRVARQGGRRVRVCASGHAPRTSFPFLRRR